MTSFVGTSVSSVLSADFMSSVNLAGHNAWPYTTNTAGAAPSALVGSLTSNLPIAAHSTEHVGVLTGSFSRDAYGHVYALPAVIDLGAIVDGGSATSEIWNASLSSVTCSNASLSDMDGIVNNIPDTPWGLSPLTSRIITYTVDDAGPVDILATQTLTFDIDTIAVVLTGQRSIVLTQWPLDEGYSEKISWVTDIIEAWAGTEQRIRVRQQPRRTINLSIRPRTARLAQILENQVQSWRANAWSLPMFHEAEKATSIVVAGDTTINVTTTNMILEAGDLIMLWWSEDTNTTLPVGSITDTSITLIKSVSNPLNSIPWIVPIHTARFTSSPTKERAPALQDKYTFEFRLTEPRDLDSDLSLPTYLDSDVFLYPSRFLNSSTQPVEFTRLVTEIDYEIGQAYVASQADFTAQQLQLDIIATNKTDAFDARKFILGRAGRTIPFWYPVYDADITLAASIGEDDTYLCVEDRSFRLLSNHETRKHIFIELTDGTKFFREVSSITSGDDGQEIFTINSSLGENISLSDISTFCFLSLYRFDEDETELEWGTAPKLKSSIMIKEVVQ